MHASGEHGGGGGRRLLAGRYRVIEQLGRGGMGLVCRARDEVLGREVAVKELRTYADASTPELADLRLRMQREARAAARVRHPGVVAVHDIAEHEGRPVIVMELVDGPSLDDVLRERGTLGPAQAADIGAKVLDALAAAHRAGVLHRDVKPGNILLERGGRVVLTDFGIAAVEEPGDADRLTGSGELLGSLDYLAPERARGEQPGPASDVWSLGATLYAAVEGVSPFRRTSTWSTLTAIVVEPLPEPRHAGPLAPALAALMDKDPGLRADAVRAAALLAEVAGGAAAPGPDTMRLGPGGAQLPAAAQPAAGPPHAAGAPAPAVPGAAYAGHGAGGTGQPDTERQTVRTRAAARRRRRVAIAASAAAVVLAGAGATWAVVGSGDGREPSAAPGPTAESDPSGSSAAGDGKGAGEQTDGERRTPGGSAGSGASERAAPPGQDGGGTGDSAGGQDGASGGEGGGPGGGSGGSGGGDDPEPGPGCTATDDGTYDCQVWKTATSYDDQHQAVGQLNAGTNYFFCQKKLPYRETDGEWTNVWWAKTDDDSGNTGVWVSDVYLEGGANDQPVPGLPTC